MITCSWVKGGRGPFAKKNIRFGWWVQCRQCSLNEVTKVTKQENNIPKASKDFPIEFRPAYLCPALRTDGVYFCIYFVFWLFWLLGPFPNGAVHELNEDDAHDQAGDDLDPGVKGKHPDPHRAESEGRGIFFNFRGSSQSQICFWHRLWDSWTQEDAQKHLFFLYFNVSQITNEQAFNGTTIEGLHF